MSESSADEWQHTEARDEPGFPALLCKTLLKFGHTRYPHYRWMEYEQNGARRCDMCICICEIPAESPVPRLQLELTGGKFSDTLQTLAREALLSVCDAVLGRSGTMPIRYFPVRDEEGPVWTHRVGTLEGPTRTVEDDTLVETALYLHALDRHCEDIHGLWREEATRAEEAVLEAERLKTQRDKAYRDRDAAYTELDTQANETDRLRAQLEAVRTQVARAYRLVEALRQTTGERTADQIEDSLVEPFTGTFPTGEEAPPVVRSAPAPRPTVGALGLPPRRRHLRRWRDMTTDEGYQRPPTPDMSHLEDHTDDDGDDDDDDGGARSSDDSDPGDRDGTDAMDVSEEEPFETEPAEDSPGEEPMRTEPAEDGPGEEPVETEPAEDRLGEQPMGAEPAADSQIVEVPGGEGSSTGALQDFIGLLDADSLSYTVPLEQLWDDGIDLYQEWCEDHDFV